MSQSKNSEGLPSSLQNLGKISLKSVFGRYLQAHDDNGELHASNDHCNEEETWFLIEIDRTNHIYALQNWRTGKYMRKRKDNCAFAESTTLSSSEQWEIVSGPKYGVVNAVAFKSVLDGTYLGSNEPDKHKDTECGGEVAAAAKTAPPMNDGMWPGWWVITGVSKPTEGSDPWNKVSSIVNGIVVNLSAADVVALLAIL